MLRMRIYEGKFQYRGRERTGTTVVVEGYYDIWFRKLEKLSKENPEGFTVSVLDLEPTEHKGYVVGFTHEDLEYWKYVTHLERWLKVASYEREKYLESHPDSMAIMTIGGWYNPEDGQYVVDVGLQLGDLDYALKLARKYKQIGVFDFSTFETIYVNK